MSLKRVAVVCVVALLLISLCEWELNGTSPPSRSQFRVGFLPVTCHLTCPVTNFINKTAAEVLPPISIRAASSGRPSG